MHRLHMVLNKQRGSIPNGLYEEPMKVVEMGLRYSTPPHDWRKNAPYFHWFQNIPCFISRFLIEQEHLSLDHTGLLFRLRLFQIDDDVDDDAINAVRQWNNDVINCF